jgi:hypothetical protein
VDGHGALHVSRIRNGARTATWLAWACAPAGLVQLVHGGTAARWAAGLARFAAGLLVPATVRPAVLIAGLAAAFIWVAGEHFGSLFSGSTTDPNTGPLLLLIAAAFWPRRQR